MTDSQPTLSPKQRAFLKAFTVAATIAGASKAAKVGRNQHRQWMNTDKGYAAAFADAAEDAADALEAEAYRRALQGVRRPVMHGGKQCEVLNPETGKMELLFEHQYSDILAIFLLKGLRPSKFAERSEQRILAENIHSGNPAPSFSRHFTNDRPTWFERRVNGDSSDLPEALPASESESDLATVEAENS
jgi:hypothetical protein